MAKIVIDSDANKGSEQEAAIYLDGEPQDIILAVVAMLASSLVAEVLKNAVKVYAQAREEKLKNPATKISVAVSDEAKAEYEKVYKKYGK